MFKLKFDNWSISENTYEYIQSICLERKPKNILDIGSGVSTVLFSKIAREFQGNVVALEHDLKFYQKTIELLSENKVSADLRYSPLVEYRIDEKQYLWYDFECDFKIDVLFIDGPPGSICKHSRYPAVPILLSHLSESSIVLMDDANRLDESEILESWKELLPEYISYRINTERGLHVFSK